ncbi:hypothetical protein ACFX19_003022 [Malus domestica]
MVESGPAKVWHHARRVILGTQDLKLQEYGIIFPNLNPAESTSVLMEYTIGYAPVRAPTNVVEEYHSSSQYVRLILLHRISLE